MIKVALRHIAIEQAFDIILRGVFRNFTQPSKALSIFELSSDMCGRAVKEYTHRPNCATVYDSDDNNSIMELAFINGLIFIERRSAYTYSLIGRLKLVNQSIVVLYD